MAKIISSDEDSRMSMYRALFPLSLGKTHFLIGTIYESLRKKIEPKISFDMIEGLVYLSEFLETVVSLRFGRNAKDQPANHLTCPPDFIRSPASGWQYCSLTSWETKSLLLFKAFSNTRLCKFWDQKVCSNYGRKYVDLTLVFHLCLDGYLIHLRALHNTFKGSLSLNLFQVTEHCCCSVAKSCLTLCDPMKHTRLPCPSLSPRVCSDSCPSSQWYLWSPMVLLNPMAWFSGHYGF